MHQPLGFPLLQFHTSEWCALQAPGVPSVMHCAKDAEFHPSTVVREQYTVISVLHNTLNSTLQYCHLHNSTSFHPGKKSCDGRVWKHGIFFPFTGWTLYMNTSGCANYILYNYSCSYCSKFSSSLSWIFLALLSSCSCNKVPPSFKATI